MEKSAPSMAVPQTMRLTNSINKNTVHMEPATATQVNGTAGQMTENQDMINRAFVFDTIDVEMVQRVYKAILSKGSFNRTHDNEQALAKFLVRCLQGGTKDEESLRLVGENAAIIKWSKTEDL